MSTAEIQTLIGTVLIDQGFCNELLSGQRSSLLEKFDLTDEEWKVVLGIETDSVQEFVAKLYEWLTT
ncbi:MAG: hypothetical protein SXV54_12850 [Chloroflexota bacterium]|nr:hypothetical protein [Chloroflexota bacterium]